MLSLGALVFDFGKLEICLTPTNSSISLIVAVSKG